ncbi:MAG: SPOCS domain-containing protein, partial [Lachnospiraceae bacterium]
KRDILRIREQYELSSNKPNIGNIVWSAPELRNVESKAVTDELQVRGDIHLFAMYFAEDSNDNVQYVEESLPFVGKVPLPGANEGMIANVAITPSQKCVSVKPDYDGEPRIMEAELVLDLDIKLYEEQTLNLITDVYSVKKNVKPVQNKAQYDELLIRNHTRCRTGDKVKLGERKDKILQIISSTAGISIDEMTVAEDGLMVEGAAKVNILYISDNDNERIGCITKELPFSQKIDASGIREDSFYTVSAAVEQLNTAMLGSDELEIKFIAGLDALILNPMDTQVITELEEEPLDYNVIRKLPGISGYIVKSGDSLWNIAKKHYTTVERIMELNNLPSENIKPGMKLLITRSVS